MRRPKVRLVDIAREAEVSLATVDRAINGRPGVHQRTAEKIRLAIRRLEAAAVAQPVARTRRLKFDVIVPAGSNTFWRNLVEALNRAGGDLAGRGMALSCHRIEGFNPTALAESILDLSRGSNGLAVAALENPVVREAVNTVAERGIPIVTLVCDLSNARKAAYVGLDNRAAGRTAGYLMGRFAGGRAGRVALIAGSIGLSYRDHQEREMGFLDALHEHFPNLEIADRYEDHDDFQKAHDQTRIILDRFPDLLGIYNVGGGSRGIGTALVEVGRGGDIIFVGHELTRFTRRFLIEGVMDAVINQDVAHMAMATLQHLLEFHGEVLQAPRLGQPHIEVFVRENLP